MTDTSRRAFIRCAAAGLSAPALAALPLIGTTKGAPAHESRPIDSAPQRASTICVFSKHLQFLDYEAMAEAAAEAGFDGVDLTVRPGGHVLPENADRDLPRAVRAVHAVGLAVPMMTTAIARIDDPHAELILRTAADLGIQYYRMNWIDYDDRAPILHQLRAYRPHLERLAELNRELGLHGAYQNHAGTSIGAAVWDLHILLDGLDPVHVGVQYDIRHATVEGANSWPLGLRLLHSFIKTTVIKDFTWNAADGGSEIENVPLGEGIVDFAGYHDLLVDLEVTGPISLHFEYEMPGEGAESNLRDRTAKTIAVMRRDLETLRLMRSEAGL